MGNCAREAGWVDRWGGRCGTNDRMGVGCCCVHLTGAVGTEASQQLKANVSLHTHRAGMDLKDVCATLKQNKRGWDYGGKKKQLHKRNPISWPTLVYSFMVDSWECLHVNTVDSPRGQAGWTRSSCPDVRVSWGPGPGCPVCWWPSALWCCRAGRSHPAGWWAPASSSGPHCLHQHRRQNEHLAGSKPTVSTSR